MKKILIVNGHEYFSFATGELNRTLVEKAVDILTGKGHQVLTSIPAHGYDVKEEQEKFLWADVTIFQTPIYWYSYPGAFKSYIDAVYDHGVFYGNSDGKEYGRYGLMNGRQYMLSVTWGAPESAFNEPGAFFDGKKVDDVLIALHKNHQFTGMTPLPTFSAHGVFQADIDSILKHFEQHLQVIDLSWKAAA